MMPVLFSLPMQVPMPPPKPKSPRLRKLPSPRVGNSSQADKEDDSTALWASGTAITLGRPVATDEGEAMPPGSHAAQAAAGSQPAATQKLKPSERAKLRSQSFHLGQAKIDELLGRDVDPVLSNLLMEMRGSIRCAHGYVCPLCSHLETPAVRHLLELVSRSVQEAS
jgi:hypothetical protein